MPTEVYFISYFKVCVHVILFFRSHIFQLRQLLLPSFVCLTGILFQSVYLFKFQAEVYSLRWKSSVDAYPLFGHLLYFVAK